MADRKIVFMLSGLGSHYYMMGRELFAFQPRFRRWMLFLDETVNAILGKSVISCLYDRSKRKGDYFDNTLQANLSILIIEYALAMTLIDSDIEPDILLGSSFGEIVAYAISRVLTLEDIIRLTIRMTQLLESRCQEGGMLAVLGSPSLYHDIPLVYENSELASVSFHSHFILSGENNKLRMLEKYFSDSKVDCFKLPVTIAFHSKMIDPIAEQFIEYLKKLNYHKPTVPVVSCCDGEMISEISAEHVWRIIRRPILFQHAIRRLENHARLNHREHLYLDIGPSGTLANYANYILSDSGKSTVQAIITPHGNELNNCEKVFRLHK